jgi:hypothetical protein
MVGENATRMGQDIPSTLVCEHHGLGHWIDGLSRL